jgi:ribose transport system substrate-binding protein
MNCDISACTSLGLAVKQAVQAAGWKFVSIPTQIENPQSQVTAMQEALRYKPSYLITGGIPETSGWESEVPIYKKDHIGIIPLLTDTPVGGGIVGQVGGDVGTIDGTEAADWFISDSDGKGSALLVNTTGIEQLTLYSTAFAATVAANCPGCTVTTLTLAESESVTSQYDSSIVSDLLANPSIGYVMINHLPFADGLVSALSAAGLAGKVKIEGQDADVVAETEIQNGTASAMTGNPIAIASWMAVDLALRNSEGMKYPPNGYPVPIQLLTQNVNFTPSNSANPPNIVKSFKALWHVK